MTEREDDLPAIDAVSLLACPFRDPEFIVEHLVAKGGITLVSADTGGGKSALLLHLSVAVALGLPVAGRFAVEPDAKPVLYLNGEMPGATLVHYLQQAAAAFSEPVPPHRILFEGPEGVAAFRFDEAGRARLEGLVDRVSPSIVVFDTQRSLFDIDENDAADVRRAFSYVRALCARRGSAAIIAHHLRKIGPVSNSDRERVSGSRDIIAAVDVHLALRSRDGRPLHALAIGKTRTPFNGVAAGTEWPIEARLEPGRPPRSIIVAGDPTSSEIRASVLEGAEDELRARLEAEGPLTLEVLGATSGNRKRAYEALRKAGEIIEVGKDGRKTVYGLAGVHGPVERVRSDIDRTRDRVRDKPLLDEGSNAVSGRLRSDRPGLASEDGGRALKARPPSEPSSAVSGQTIYDRDRDRVHPLSPRYVGSEGAED